MLDSLRANKGGIITYIFLGAIIIVFVISFGPGSFAKGGAGCGGAVSATSAATVNGKTIPVTDWERQYNQLLRMFQQQSGPAFSADLARQLGLPLQALNQLVDRELVAQEARHRGVVVTDQELSKAVHEIPAFQTNGKFDYDQYEQYASSSYGSPGRFEAVFREDLLYQKMLAAVKETVKVSDAEVRQAWQSEGDRAALSFVRFPVAAAAAEVKPSDADVKAFADKNGARIEQFYRDNAARYDQPKKVKARHILVKVAPTASPDQDAAARKKIEALADRVKKGEDFAKVAAQASDDANTKARGGDLGVVTEAVVEKPFAEAAFALAPGQVSAPVRTATGWHLIKVDEVIPAKKVPLDAARADIARELLSQDRAKALAEEKARGALAALQGGKSLADLFPADKKGKATFGGQPLAVDETGPFTAGSPFVPKLGAVPALAADAFAAKTGAVLPKVYDTPVGPVVAVVKLREQPDAAAFASQKDAFAARLRSRREAQVEQAWLKQLRDGAKIALNTAVVNGTAAPRGEE